MTFSDESLFRLLRAVWAAGFRAGKGSIEEGKPKGPHSAWVEEVQWRIDSEPTSYYYLDILNPDMWDDVP